MWMNFCFVSEQKNKLKNTFQNRKDEETPGVNSYSFYWCFQRRPAEEQSQSQPQETAPHLLQDLDPDRKCRAESESEGRARRRARLEEKT